MSKRRSSCTKRGNEGCGVFFSIASAINNPKIRLDCLADDCRALKNRATVNRVDEKRSRCCRSRNDRLNDCGLSVRAAQKSRADRSVSHALDKARARVLIVISNSARTKHSARSPRYRYAVVRVEKKKKRRSNARTFPGFHEEPRRRLRRSVTLRRRSLTSAGYGGFPPPRVACRRHTTNFSFDFRVDSTSCAVLPVTRERIVRCEAHRCEIRDQPGSGSLFLE